MRLYFLICFVLLLTACAEKTPQVFGIPLSEWKKATETQRQNLIEQYNVNRLTRYNTESRITMNNIASSPHSKPQEQLSILGENQTKSLAMPQPKQKTAPPKVEATVPPEQMPAETSWLRLNDN